MISATQPRDDTYYTEAEQELDAVLSTLSKREHEVLRAKFFDGLSLTESGLKLGLTHNSVRWYICDALRKLRRPSRKHRLIAVLERYAY